jgi:hypothetical protein
MSSPAQPSKTYSARLIDIIEQLLIDGTSAGGSVYRSRTWPLTIAKLPAILLNSVYIENRESTGNAAPEFNTTTTITIAGRVSAPGETGDYGADLIVPALERLKREIETTIINAYPLMLDIENFPRISTEFEVSREAKDPVGEVRMTFDMRFREGPEDFVNTEADAAPIAEMSISTDLVNIFDPSGTYAGTLFPQSVVPAPRTHGPDGRLEGGGLLFTNLFD